MNIFGTATIWAKLALVLIIIAFALHIAGFATTFWQQSETIQENTVYDMGLWKAQDCSGGHGSPCDTIDIPDSFIDGSYKAVQGLECFILVLMFIIVVLAAVYVATERFREMAIAVVITVLCFLTVTFGMIAMIIWVAQIPTNYYLGYSCGLCIVAFVLIFLAGILMIPDIRNYQQRSGREALKVRPEHRPTVIERPSKYDDMGRHDYSYNKRFTPETPMTNVRHYYNPNRDSYIRSPPPAYKTMASPDQRTAYTKYTRTDIQTPDVYLGRDSRKLRRY